jgi:hypothetical protein
VPDPLLLGVPEGLVVGLRRATSTVEVSGAMTATTTLRYVGELQRNYYG